MKSKFNYIGIAVVLIGLILVLKALGGAIGLYWLIPVFSLSIFNIYQSAISDDKYARKVYNHRLNFMVSKSVETIHTEIEPDLLFDKVVEEIRKSKLRISYASRKERLVAISTPMSLRSWGERIYFEVVEKGKNADLIIESIAPGQVISYGKNKENTKKLIQHIEDSFTI